jgi:hypothetical protein
MHFVSERRPCLENANRIKVEVAYALPGEQVILPVEVPAGATAEEAIRESGVMQKYPEIDLQVNKVGIFGKLAKLSAVLRPLDRVEIYRPLLADPKEVRRQRAAQGKKTKRGAGVQDETPDVVAESAEK